jgi:hypothetical protein
MGCGIRTSGAESTSYSLLVVLKCTILTPSVVKLINTYGEFSFSSEREKVCKQSISVLRTRIR